MKQIEREGRVLSPLYRINGADDSEDPNCSLPGAEISNPHKKSIEPFRMVWVYSIFVMHQFGYNFVFIFQKKLIRLIRLHFRA